MASVTPTAVIADTESATKASTTDAKKKFGRAAKQFGRAAKKLTDWSVWGLVPLSRCSALTGWAAEKGGELFMDCGDITDGTGRAGGDRYHAGPGGVYAPESLICLSFWVQLTDRMVQQEAFEQFQRQQSATVVVILPTSDLSVDSL